MSKNSLIRDFLKKTFKEQKRLILTLFLALLGMSLGQAALLFGTKGFMMVLFSVDQGDLVRLGDLFPLEHWITEGAEKGSGGWRAPPWLQEIYHYEFVRRDLIFLVPGYFLVAGLIQAVSHYGYQLSQQLLSLRVAAAYRDRLFAAIVKLPYLSQKSKSPAQWMSLVMNDVIYLQSRLTDLTTAVLKDSVLVGVSFLSLWVIHWPTAMALALLVPLLAFFMGRAGRRVTLFAEGFQLRLGRMAAAVHDWRQRFDFVVAQGGHQRELSRFKDLTEEYFALMNRSLMIRAFISPLLEWLGFMFLAALLFLVGMGVWQHFKGDDLLQLMVALGLLMKPVKELGEQLARYHETKGILRSSLTVFASIEQETSGTRGPRQVGDGGALASVVIHKVHVGVDQKTLFASEKPWGFRAGESLAMIGPSGAGKTSLIRCLAGLIEPREWVGSVPWDILVPQASFVSQEPFLFHDSIRHNLLYGSRVSPEKGDASLWEVLAFVGLDEEIQSFSQKLDTPILAFSHNVSGGQLQRLVIARALLRDQKILLLDEATSAIDSDAEEKLLKRLISDMRRRSRTMIAITHRMQWLPLFDKILFIEGGQLTMFGTYDALCREERFREFCRAETDA